MFSKFQLFTLALCAVFAEHANAHGALVNVAGANGVQASGFGIIATTPRDGTTRNPFQQDTSIIRQNEVKTGKASACGRTLAGGVNDIATQLANASAAGLPTASADGTVSMTLHQVNGDGAGPYTCDVSGDGGQTFQAATVTTNVPGTKSRSKAKATDFALVAQMPAGMACTGGPNGDACIMRCMNSAAAGPFGGCVAVASGASNATAAAGTGTATNSTTAAGTGAATGSTGSTDTTGSAGTTDTNSTSTTGQTTTGETSTGQTTSNDGTGASSGSTGTTGTESTTGQTSTGSTGTTGTDSTGTTGTGSTETTGSDTTTGQTTNGQTSSGTTGTSGSTGTTGTESTTGQTTTGETTNGQSSTGQTTSGATTSGSTGTSSGSTGTTGTESTTGQTTTGESSTGQTANGETTVGQTAAGESSNSETTTGSTGTGVEGTTGAESAAKAKVPRRYLTSRVVGKRDNFWIEA